MKKYLAFLLVMSLIVVAGVQIQNSQEKETPLKDRNYIAEVYLGVTPNMPTREPTVEDIDTQINLQTGDGRIYRLIESRDFITYGKTFAVPLN